MELLRSKWRALVWGTLLLVCACHPVSAELLTSLSEIRNLSREEAARNPLVDLEVHVVYSDPDWETYFVADEKTGLYLRLSGNEIRAGDRIRVQGAVKPSSGHPELEHKTISVEILGRDEEGPRPLKKDIREWELGGALDAEWLEFEAKILQSSIRHGHAYLWVEDTTTSHVFLTHLPRALTLKKLSMLDGKTFKLKGAIGHITGLRASVTLRPCLFMDPRVNPELMEALEGETGEIPLVDIRELYHHRKEGFFEIRCVAAYIDEGFLCIQDETAGILVGKLPVDQLRRLAEVEPGQPIQFLGWQEQGGENRRLAALEGLYQPFQNDPEVQRVSEVNAITDFLRVSVIGRLRAELPDQAGSEPVRYFLEQDGSEIEVKLPPSFETEEVDSILSVQISGVVIPHSPPLLGQSESIIAVARLRDINILRKRFSLGHRSTAVARSFLGLGAILGSLWVRFLRRRIAQKDRGLAELNAQLKSSYDSAGIGMVAIGVDDKILVANRDARRLLGVDLERGVSNQIFEQALEEQVLERDHGSLEKILAEPSSSETKMELALDREARDPGILSLGRAPIRTNPKPEGDSGDLMGTVWILSDESEKSELRNQLNQAQKLEAVGTLAGGVAHDFNNLLTGIGGNLQLMQLDPEMSSEERAVCLETALGATNRAGGLVSQLLGLSRPSPLHLERVSTNALLKAVKTLLDRTLDPRWKIEIQGVEQAREIIVDQTRIEQILLNLTLNARDAMPDGGTIVLSSMVRDGNGVILSVADEGTGIPEEIRDKILEPFFTTKQPGSGTGLGLATSRALVEQHGGDLTFESRKSGGTRFLISLPDRNEDALQSSDGRAEALSKLEGQILVVDDDDLVRRTTSRMLNRMGLKTTKASDGEEALAILRARRSEIDLVLLDVVMPGLGGEEVLRILKDESPTLPVVLCSGYAFEGVEISDADESLSKPFTQGQLHTVLRKLLSESSSAA